MKLSVEQKEAIIAALQECSGASVVARRTGFNRNTVMKVAKEADIKLVDGIKSRGKVVRLKPEKRALIIQIFEEFPEATIAFAAQKARTSKRSVQIVVNENAIQVIDGKVIRGNRLKPHKRKEAIAAFASGRTLKDIADRVGVSVPTLHKIAVEENLDYAGKRPLNQKISSGTKMEPS